MRLERRSPVPTLIKGYRRLTPEQQFVILEDEFGPRIQWVLEWWVEDWQENVLKQTLLVDDSE
jgi:hypothetical protein